MPIRRDLTAKAPKNTERLKKVPVRKTRFSKLLCDLCVFAVKCSSSVTIEPPAAPSSRCQSQCNQTLKNPMAGIIARAGGSRR